MAKETYNGQCLVCDMRISKSGMTRHLKGCIPARLGVEDGAEETDLVHLRVEGRNAPMYWLDVQFPGRGTLEDLDRFLRAEWVECCDHLSSFTIGPLTYGDGYEARSTAVALRRALPDPGVRFEYEYDFGSTTHLTLRVIGWRQGSIGGEPVRILARNQPLAWKCTVCGEPAMWVCSFCDYDLPDPFFCKEHGPEHECGEDGLLPVVDSPRMGVCGYGF